MNIKLLLTLSILYINYLKATSRSFSLLKKFTPSIASIENNFPKKAFLTGKKKSCFTQSFKVFI